MQMTRPCPQRVGTRMWYTVEVARKVTSVTSETSGGLEDLEAKNQFLSKKKKNQEKKPFIG